MLRGGGTFHPDFYCLNVRTREEIVLEHFGRMDDPEYSSNSFVFKIQKYDAAGFVFGETFIFTAESLNHPLSSKNIENLIKKHLL